MKKQLYRIKKKTFNTLKVRKYGKVNLFVVGEQKAGTTSLFQWLVNNSNAILKGEVKELQFFNRDQLNLSDIKAYEKRFKYSLFEPRRPYAIDASPDYATYNYPNYTAIKRILEYNPQAKFIYCTRDPIERYLSAYRFYSQRVTKIAQSWDPGAHSIFWTGIFSFLKAHPDGFSLKDFNDLELSSQPIFNALIRGLYREHVQELKKLIPSENLLILPLEEQSNPDQLAQLMTNFLGVQVSSGAIRIVGATKRSEESESEEEIALLRSYYKNYY